MADDLARAFAFMRRADLRGTHEQPFRYGTAVFTPELPLRHDSNYLDVDRPVESAARLEAEADRLFGAAGLHFRVLLFRDAAEGERLAAGLPRFAVDRSVVMVRRRRPDADVDTAAIVELGPDGVRAARGSMILGYEWGSPEVAKQLLDAKNLLAAWVTVRCFAAIEGGAVVSYADLYLHGAAAQVEDVATLPEHRGRGHAKAVVTRAADEARAAGAEFVFLVAAEDDWPKELYRRLGFDVVGRYVKLVRREE